MDEPVTGFVFRPADPRFEWGSLRSFQVLTFCHHDFHTCLFFFSLFSDVKKYRNTFQEVKTPKRQLLENLMKNIQFRYGIYSPWYCELICPLVSLPHTSSALDPAKQAAFSSVPGSLLGKDGGVTFPSISMWAVRPTYQIPKGYCTRQTSLSIF